MINYTKNNELIKEIEEVFNRLLNESLNIINNKLNPKLSIDKYENEFYLFNNKLNTEKKKYKLKNSEIEYYENENKLYFIKKINSDIGEYFLTIEIINKDNEDEIFSYIIRIIEYIIRKCENHVKIDIEEFFSYENNNDICQNCIVQMLNKDLSGYLEFHKNTYIYDKYYNELINTIHIDYYEFLLTERQQKHSIIHNLNELSCTPYESNYSKGQIAILHDIDIIKYLDDNPDSTIKFNEHIEINDYKNMRKVLEMTNWINNDDTIESETVAISDGFSIFGIGTINDNIKDKASSIKFNGHYTYTIELYNMEPITMKYGTISYTKQSNLNSKDIIMEKIKKTFKNISDSDENKLNEIIDAIKEQSKGSMLVISEEAIEEADRLMYQSTLIKPKRLSKEDINRVSRIDGSILIDKNGTCYAIGVILDGVATNIGDKARGARYNSAIKYIRERIKEHHYTCLAIVISEDGMIDVIDKDTINKLESNCEKTEKIKNPTSKKYENILMPLEMSKSAKLNVEATDNFISECIDVIKSNLENKYMYMKKGSVYEYLGMLKKSIECYDKYIETCPEDYELFFARGYAYYMQNNLEKALEDYDKALKLEPSNTYVSEKKVIVLSELGELEKALEICNSVLQLDNKNGSFYVLRGDIYFRLNEYIKALEDFNKALSINKNLPGAYNGRANIYYKDGKFIEALENYNKVIHLKVIDPYVYMSRGRTYTQLGYYDNALKDFNFALNLDKYNAEKYNAEIHSDMGYLYSRLSNMKGALENYNKSISLDKKNMEIYLDRGLMFFSFKEYELALDDFTKVIETLDNKQINKLDKKQTNILIRAYTNRSYIYYCLDESKKFKKDIDKVKILDIEEYNKYMRNLNNKVRKRK